MPPATEEPNKTASSTRFMSSRPRTSSISSRTRPMMTRSRPSYGLTPPQPTPLPVQVGAVFVVTVVSNCRSFILKVQTRTEAEYQSFGIQTEGKKTVRNTMPSVKRLNIYTSPNIVHCSFIAFFRCYCIAPCTQFHLIKIVVLLYKKMYIIRVTFRTLN
ncbi:uncharacterized protein LOC112194897 [Rosa chinensis]|uniref:uncharacterized protein LOC112194897 n=1 Tax=Rosa chinensis TaxID=74649 RepID=UPI000D08C8B6|nr:uncharacterized protein LOC112194897 [Rosa chinensis]